MECGLLVRSVLEWTAEHDRERNASAVAQCLAQGFLRNFTVDYRDEAGRITPVEANATVVGIGADRLTSNGVSYLAPVSTNSTDAGRGKNRRVELVLF